MLRPPYTFLESGEIAIAPRNRIDVAPSADVLPDERRYLPALLLAFGLANLTAYARDATIAAVFGAGERTDAYFVGAFLPTLLVTILVFESAVPALLPAFSRIQGDAAATRTLLRRAVVTGLVGLGCTVAAIWVLAEPLVRVLAHGWRAEEVHVAASLLRITGGSLVPLGIGAVLAALLNVHHRYLYAPLGMALMNAAALASTMALGGRLGIYAPAWGMLAGSVLYLALQVRAILRLNLQADAARVNGPLSRIAPAMLPTLIFSCLVQNVALVERWLASTLPAGQISHLAYAGKLMMSPLLVITAAGGLLAFVAMSQAAAAGDQAALRASLARSARMLTLLLAMATVTLVSLRRPIVQLALQHGHFTDHDTDVTAMLLAIYALGLVPNGLSWLLYRALQSRGRYWEAVRVALVSAAFHLVCALALFHLWGLPGIAAAFPLSQTASCLILYARLPVTLRTPGAHSILYALPVTLLCLTSAAALAAMSAAIDPLAVDPTARAVLSILGGALIILGVLARGSRFLGLSEGTLVHEWLSRAARAPERWLATVLA